MPTTTTKKKITAVKKLVKDVKPARKSKKTSNTSPKQKVPQVRPLPPNQRAQSLVGLPAHVVAAMEAAKATAAKTPAQQIWDEIKDLTLQMFGLPGQTVTMHASPIWIEPSKLYLTIRSSATLPSLEEAVKGKFNVELVDKFVIVTRVLAPLVPRRS